MIDDRMPVFVCKCCGNIIRAIAYEDCDVYNCRICNFVMSKTDVLLNDKEYNDIFSDPSAAFEFRKRIYSEYVEGNEFFDSSMSRKRLDEETKKFNKWMYG